MTNSPLSVSAVVRYIKNQLDRDDALQQLVVSGEISNFKRYGQGHCYFTLKDETSRMKAVMFARETAQLSFQPENGMKVVIVARVAMYEATGDVQLYVQLMRPDGVGVLHERYEALKSELEGLGWFDASLKQDVPRFPERVGIITSPKGAALSDIATTLRRRAPHVAITFAPVNVQGELAAPQIAKAIELMNELTTCDVLIVGRGGGSIEELWAFNERVVVEAVFRSNIPVISAVGHETDFTLTDFVADLRAATPTAAAELATLGVDVFRKDVAKWSEQLHQVMQRRLLSERERLARAVNSYGLRSPKSALEQKRQRFEQGAMRLERSFDQQKRQKRAQLALAEQRLQPHVLEGRIQQLRQTLAYVQKELRAQRPVNEQREAFRQLVARLQVVSPLHVLTRGYAMVEQNGRYVQRIGDLEQGPIRIRMHDGHVTAEVKEREDGKHDGTNI